MEHEGEGGRVPLLHGCVNSRPASFVAPLRQLPQHFILPKFKPTVNMSQLSVSPVPGSHRVWTRGSSDADRLVPCTSQSCPMATTYDLGQPPQSTLVNHAPLSPGSNLAGAINRGWVDTLHVCTTHTGCCRLPGCALRM